MWQTNWKHNLLHSFEWKSEWISFVKKQTALCIINWKCTADDYVYMSECIKESDANRCTCSNNQSKCRSTIFFNIKKYLKIIVENLHSLTLIISHIIFTIFNNKHFKRCHFKRKKNKLNGQKLKRFAFKHIQTIFILHFSSLFSLFFPFFFFFRLQ